MEPKEIKKLFVNRKDVFAQQTKNGTYFPIKEELTLDRIQEHVDGKRTLGVYVLNTENKVKFACVDIDAESEKSFIANPSTTKKLAIKIYGLFKDKIIDRKMLEFSGRRGYHVWLFFKRKQFAKFIKIMVETRLHLNDIYRIEVFPKQTKLTPYRRYGSLIKLPFGIHKKSGKRSVIIMDTEKKGEEVN